MPPSCSDSRQYFDFRRIRCRPFRWNEAIEYLRHPSPTDTEIAGKSRPTFELAGVEKGLSNSGREVGNRELVSAATLVPFRRWVRRSTVRFRSYGIDVTY